MYNGSLSLFLFSFFFWAFFFLFSRLFSPKDWVQYGAIPLVLLGQPFHPALVTQIG